MQRLFGFKGTPPQAIPRSLIVAHSYSSGERPINRLGHRPPNLSRLEGWKLRRDIGHHQPAHENGTLRASQGHDGCTGSSRGDHRCGCTSSRSSEVNCYRSRLAFHIQILVLTMLLPRIQKKAIHSLLPSNKWPDKETEQHNGSVPQSVHQLGAR